MEYFISICSLLIVAWYFGETGAKVTIDVPETILIKQPTSGTCVASGNMYSRMRPYFMKVKLVGSNAAKCNMTLLGELQKIGHAQYQQNFNITCGNGNSSVGIQCFTHVNNERTKVLVQVIKPKVTTKCSNITTEVGLPVTLTCFVEGDPKHYWVGWLSRNTVIHTGEEHSISTAPNFRSPNGTIHYLTIHSIKKSGKYECKVFSMTGDVQDQVSHQVLVNKESASPKENSSSSSSSSSPSSLFIILSNLFI